MVYLLVLAAILLEISIINFACYQINEIYKCIEDNKFKELLNKIKIKMEKENKNE